MWREIDTYGAKNKLTHMKQIFSDKVISLLLALWKVEKIDTYGINIFNQ
ncbi:MAG TPA: hypothetical protein PK385_08510 [Spirochaetota bacterium]|nr:hypothetical protein [Spirochaetota bacterium]HOS32899.1 hypothetical protein [Spirochaetota bacterium]HOS56085.1 hypothetical protein [Spirochaetota bacterium]HQF76826.1 hypothetical protein [Spirochaetota bacterium]HQH29319.1 hypothetical protein [Spirochaetota bacterium]